MGKKILMCGNEVIAEAAIRAGCRFYAGYPITPQNELPAYMARRMPEVGGTFIQSESEIAGINMGFGASLAGARAMTSSSSPGISLKQEGISYLAACELPAVIVNIMRGGPGLGNIAPSQSDYFQATKGGGHGDYHSIVLAPASVQEMAELTFLSFELADIYRTPVIILADGILGQMMEPVEFRPHLGAEHPDIRHLGARQTSDLRPQPKKDWILDGCKGRPPRVIRSLLLDDHSLEQLNLRLQKKYGEIKKREVRYEVLFEKDSKIFLVSYGTTSRICRDVVLKLRKKGLKAGLVRPITLWPFPGEPIKKLARRGVSFLVVEMSLGQMVEDVRLAVEGRSPVYFYGRTGGSIPKEEAIIQRVTDLVKR